MGRPQVEIEVDGATGRGSVDTIPTMPVPQHVRKVHGSRPIVDRAAADTAEIVAIVSGARNIDQLLRSTPP